MSHVYPRSPNALRALPANIVLIVGVFLQTVVQRMANFHALDADKVDAFNSLVDPLAVENPSLELFDADTEKVHILALDLTPSCFVFRQVGIFFGFFRGLREIV